MKTIRIKISRDVAEDFAGYMLNRVFSTIEIKASQGEWAMRIVRSICEEIRKEINRLIINTSKRRITFKFQEYQAIAIMMSLIAVLLDNTEIWRNMYRNDIINQIHRQL